MLCLHYEFILAWSHLVVSCLPGSILNVQRNEKVKGCIVASVLNGYCNAGKYDCTYMDPKKIGRKKC